MKNKKEAIDDAIFALNFDINSLRNLSRDLADAENPYGVDRETGELLYYDEPEALRKEINDVKTWISHNYSILHKLMAYEGDEIPLEIYSNILGEGK